MGNYYLKSLFTLCLIVVVTTTTYGQELYDQYIMSRTNSPQLELMRSIMQPKIAKEFSEAEAMAKTNGWPIYIETGDGGWIQLIRLNPNGDPVYYGSDNAVSAAIINTDDVRTMYGLMGSGIVIREWDGGNVRQTHEQFNPGARVLNLDGGGNSDHSTHVAGTMIGDGNPRPDAMGMAPAATLRAYDSSGDIPEMMTEASMGALVSNHSYSVRIGWEPGLTGCGDGTTPRWYGSLGNPNGESELFGQYGNTSRDMDLIANMAPMYLIFRSAGNDRGQNGGNHYHGCGGTIFNDMHEIDGGANGFDTAKDGGTAKNVMSVGALDDTGDQTTTFSGWGPTDDGRIKPDICANGLSLTSSQIGNPDVDDDQYGSKSGTSMSTPSVTGSAALLQEHYNNELAGFMRASTLKALIIHSADDIGNAGPDYSNGWGRMNTLRAVEIIDERVVDSDKIRENVLTDIAPITFQVYATGIEPLSTTIVWNDPAGSAVSGLDNPVSNLTNDLDLRITGPGGPYMPWVLDPVNPATAATTGDNIRDNVENILIPNPTPGVYTITINSKNVLGVSGQELSIITTGIVACFPDNVICPESQTYNLDAGCNSPNATYPDFRGLVILDIDCQALIDTVIQTPSPGSPLTGDPGDVLPVNIQFFDAGGGFIVECDLDLTLEDNQNPNIFCPTQKEVVMDDACAGVLDDYTGDAIVSDNCEDVTGCALTVTQIPAPGVPIGFGDTIMVTLTVTDCNNNSSSCTFDVIGVDRTPPVIITPAVNDTVDCDGMGNTAELMAWLANNGGATAEDNCKDEMSLLWSNEILYIDDGCNNTSATFYRFTVADTCGNSAFTDAAFVIQDTLPPVITGGMDTTFVCDQSGAGNDNALLSWLNNNAGATAVDACGGMVFWSNDFLSSEVMSDCGMTEEFSVLFTATDECGNFDTVRFSFTLIDTLAPTFLNCPREVVVENIEAGECDAFVNFAPVIALDNCSSVTVNNISSINPVTGEPFKSGDRYPIGTTILYFEAADECGNADTCQLKVIVNDVNTLPVITACIDSIDLENDLWLCGAMSEIGDPVVFDQCPDLLITTYQVLFEGKVLETGLTATADPFFYPVGTSTVEYCVQDHPLLLITEVTQDVDTCGGMDIPPIGPVVSNDYIEITSFGPVNYNLACLVIERSFGGVIDTFIVPDSTFLAPGDVLVLQYDTSTTAVDLDPDDLLFFKGNAQDLFANDVASYRIYYGMNMIDAIDMDPLATAGIIRKAIKDTDTAADFVLAEPCNPLTLGMYNPDYPAAYDNGTGITTSLQSLPPLKDECSREVTVEDTEDPMCMEISDTLMNMNIDPLMTEVDTCNQSIITITEDCIMEYIGVSVVGLMDPANLMITLTSPKGTEYIFDAGYAGDSIQVDSFYSEKSAGDWVLHIEPIDKTTFVDFTVTSWSLNVTCLETWVMADTTLSNNVDLCSASFTWYHPYFADNCVEGDIAVEYSSEDLITVPTDVPLVYPGGALATEIFEVGTTNVKYILTDAAGNMDTCEFNVIVIDTQYPEITFCPPDITIQLAGGECRVVYEYTPTATDNCGIESIIGSIPSGSEFEIGENEVVVYVTDVNGNVDSSCVFIVTVLEFLPAVPDFACNEHLNLSLGSDCTAFVTAEMMLEGTNYRCFENYCIEIKDGTDKVIFEGFLKDTNFEFNESHEGQTFSISIIDCLGTDDILYNEEVNSCWGTVLIQEKLTPEIRCPDHIIISCSDSREPSSTGEPTLLTCEDDVEIYYWDDIVSGPECSTPAATITRTWYVEDSEGNRSSCVQIITVLPGNLNNIDWPDDVSHTKTFECPTTAEEVPLSATGIPLIDGRPANESHYCNFFVNYTDEVYHGACVGDFDIIRTWKVKNTCLPLGPDNPRVHQQNILVRDNTPPLILNRIVDMTVSTDPWTCSVSLDLPFPTVIDNCNAVNVHAKLFGGGRLVETGTYADGNLNFRANNLGLGTYKVKYQFNDGCGNESNDEFFITVIDIVKPVAVALEFTVVSLTTNNEDGTQVAKVFAESIDNGSYDKCTPVLLEVRRALRVDICDEDKDGETDDEDEWGPFVKFCCDDLDKDSIKVELRVWDDANRSQVWGDTVDGIADNYSIVWGFVKVEDPNPVRFECENVVAYCHDDYENLDYAALGNVHAFNICNEVPYDTAGPFWMTGTPSDPDPSVFKEYGRGAFEGFDYTCGYGYGYMKYTAKSSKTDPTVSYQLITIMYKDNFSCSSVNWPENDLDADCEPALAELTWDAGPCVLIGYTVVSDTFDLVTDACKKIENKYTVIDWCIYDAHKTEGIGHGSMRQLNFLWDHAEDAISNFYCFDVDNTNPHNTGVYEYAQIIKVTDDTQPVIGNCADVTINVLNADCSVVVPLENSVTDEGCENTDFRWLLQVFNDNGILIANINSLRGSPVSFDLSYNLDGEEERVLRVKWKVWDGCGNATVCEYDVTLVDRKAPTPYLVNLSSALMQDPDPNDDIDEAMVELWASDFDIGSSDGCSDLLFFTFDDVIFGQDVDDAYKYLDIPHYFDEDGFIETYADASDATRAAYLAGEIYIWRPRNWPNALNKSYTAGKVFTCADIGTEDVKVTVWDALYNHNFALVTLTLRSDDCGGTTPTAMISGNIATYDARDVSGVDVKLSDMSSVEVTKNKMTENDGIYAFAENVMYKDYEISAIKGGDDAEGVSTLDLVLIQRHILGIGEFTTPYKVIAGDINNDKKLSAVDLIQLRKLILGIYETFPSNASWRFVDKSQELHIATVLNEYNELKRIIGLEANQMNEDMVAVKIGDVNDDAVVNSREKGISTRDLNKLSLQFQDRSVKKGDVISVPFKGVDGQEIIGMQFTLAHKGLRFQDVKQKAANIDLSNIGVFAGALTLSYNSLELVDFSQELFEMEFVALEDGVLSGMLELTNGITSNEVYVGSAFDKFTLTLKGANVSAENFLYQNEPNPFSISTVISFNLASEGPVVLTFSDVTGKTISKIEQNFDKGYHELNVGKQNLGTTGLVYYTLVSGEFSSTKKMIVLN